MKLLILATNWWVRDPWPRALHCRSVATIPKPNRDFGNGPYVADIYRGQGGGG